MDAVFSEQEKIIKDLGLSKVKVIHNENYKRHGTKSYVWLLNRYRFEPTKPGPYFHVDKVKQYVSQCSSPPASIFLVSMFSESKLPV